MKWLLPFLLLWPSACLGQTNDEIPEQLELKKALEIAVANNPQLKAARNEIEIIDAENIDAAKRLNPALSAYFEDYRLFHSEMGPFFRTQEITVRLDQEIETGGKRKLRAHAAAVRSQAQKAQTDNVTRALVLDVRRAYFQAVLAQTNLENAETILQEIDRVIELNRTRFEQGDISGAELKRVEVERLKFVEDVFASKLALVNAKSTLLSLLGLPQANPSFKLSGPLTVDRGGSIPPEGIPPPLPYTDLERRALAKRPDLMASMFEQKRADTETLHQRSLRSPNITVTGGYKRNLLDNTVAFGIALPLKVFNKNEGGIARAAAEKARADNLAAHTRSLILLDVQKGYNSAEINRQRVEYIEKESIQKADESRQIVLTAYRLGEIDLIHLLDAERAFRETRKTYNQALYEYRMSLYELGSAIGLEAE
ncbi:MAG: TolC family protein [Acidobacteria bacterium]|nr:TolC family protein [Acidobacteriota bacterium]MCI0624152.1 TolC family protein [Acidobacteriota bacterium]MCI0720045.1 TolC family protein [Acidobacteriota bacterium]